MPKKDTFSFFLKLGLALLPLLCSVNLFAQKFHFNKFDIENGLSQSQVTMITQDPENYLLISTLDGVDRFDGKTFTAYTQDNGLQSNTNFAVFSDKNGVLWMAHKKGVTAYNGKIFKNYAFDNVKPTKMIRQVLVDSSNTAWAIARDKLYKATNGRLLAETVTNTRDTVLAIALNTDGVIYAMVSHKGLFYFKNNKWIQSPVNFNFSGDTRFRNIVFDPYAKGRMYLYNDVQIYTLENGRITLFKDDVLKQIKAMIMCITPFNGGMWIGTSMGAYLLKNDKLQYFNGSNGFTDYPVVNIYEDKDKNAWFATNGDGLYRFSEDAFLTIDQTSDKMNLVVMSMTKDKLGNIYLGSSGVGLLLYKNGKLTPVSIAPPTERTNIINCLFTDSGDNLLLGTAYGGFWKLRGSKSKKLYPLTAIDKPMAVTSITEDENNTVWLATTMGCYYLDKDKLIKIEGADNYYSSVKAISKGIILLGSNNGVNVIRDKKLVKDKRFDFLNGLYVMSIATYGDNVYAGTFERGVFSYKLSTGAVKSYNKATGLTSNSVYGIGISKNYLWVGTGRGIDQFSINVNGDLIYKKNPFYGVVVESNQNAVFFADDKVYLGTTKGVYIADAYVKNRALQAPHAILSNVKIYLSGDAKHPDSVLQRHKLTADLKLPYHNSHITFNFNGVQLTNPEEVNFEYQLISDHDTLTQVTAYNYADFVSLKPGQYEFTVRAFLPGNQAGNIKRFKFEVLPAFYQTTLFKIVAIIFIYLLVWGIYKYRLSVDNKKHEKLEMIKLIEQEKVRRQTAEDFHDDLGNKLTRINVLSEILETKIRKEQTDTMEIVSQIKASATEMYAGTKDILWALNPENDRLNEIIAFIEKFADTFFQHTDIRFTLKETKGAKADFKLPIGYGRNIIMIFKELLNNALKHSKATEVEMSVTVSTDKMVTVTLTDNGVGFDTAAVKRGNGLKNIRNRVKKIDGSIHFNNLSDTGTRVKLNFHIPIRNI